MPDVKEFAERKPQLKEWTVMFCFATDNPLAPGTISQLKAIKNAGFHHEVNVIAQFDPHTINMPVHIFDVNIVERLKKEQELNEEGKSLDRAFDIGFQEGDPYVRNLVLDKLWDAEVAEQIKERTKGKIDYNPPIPSVILSSEANPKESLARLLNFCRINYPARHYMLIILAHGIVVGNDLFMFDEHASETEAQQHALTLADLGDALDKFKDQISKDEPRAELELIGFHSCSMSGAEVAFELRDKANYMMASQGPIYVGSWPYRQILIRLFNDVKKAGPLRENAIAAGLFNRLIEGIGEPAIQLRNALNGNGGVLKKSQKGVPTKDDVDAVAKKLTHLLNATSLCDLKAFQNGDVRFSRKTKSLVAKHRDSPLRGEQLRELNLHVLTDAFPEEMSKAKIRRMFIKMFEYCVYNSFDFQLAGYSADLTLCDLKKVHRLQQPMARLAKALGDGLKQGKAAGETAIRDAILLAHWEAQSYFDENFTDLYDFCFRLTKQTTLPRKPKTRAALKEIFASCNEVMDVLTRGVHRSDFGPIVRCAFCGPAYQYSHGLSVFFPWAEPLGSNMWDQQYESYELNRRTGWKNFLETYFADTMRLTQEAERDRREPSKSLTQPDLDRELLRLLERMSAGMFSGIEQLAGKTGPRDPLGGPKTGGGDPAGGGSDCLTIKNYPHFTGLQISGLNGKGNKRARKDRSCIVPATTDSFVFGITSQLMPKSKNDDAD
jgi:hypothetical protein